MVCFIIKSSFFWPVLAFAELYSRVRFTYPRESRARSKNFTSRGIYAVFTRESRAVHIREHPQIYGKYGGFGVLVVGGGGVSSSLQVSCVVRASFSSRPFLPPCACAFSCSAHRYGSFLATSFNGGGLHKHGAGLSAGRGSDVDKGGLVDDKRITDFRVVCIRNLFVMVAWHQLTHQNSAFLLP